ncbi:hypothetical protein ABZ671_01145 [Micromonospora sp. NPDC006766]|uniref:hypothetical protein n=1 Tax=Micromonospora sp. NPDC006766 TaxID=3154778 RepID=UPI0033F9BD12
MVMQPTITAGPDAPEWWECRGTELAADIAAPGDPADLTDVEVGGIVDAAVSELRTWHDLAETMPTRAWEPLATPDSWSGHKLHIGCADFADVRAVVAKVLPVVISAGLGCKAATSSVGLRRGKGVVVYLPRRDRVDRDASLVVQALAGYQPSAPVDIFGSVRLSGAVWWRWEFREDPGCDVWSRAEYRDLYVKAPVPA